jgi:hypothetical protein
MEDGEADIRSDFVSVNRLFPMFGLREAGE